MDPLPPAGCERPGLAARPDRPTVPRRLPTLDLASVLASVADTAPPSGPEDATATAMLDATSQLISRYGLHRWSLDDVAARATLGRATVYRKFAGRDELVHATLARDAHRFFAAIALAVRGARSVEDRLVDGFVVGVRAARRSLLGDLVRCDGAEAIGLLMAAPVLAIARDALIDAYGNDADRSGEGHPLPDPATAALVAEAVVRLALSFVLIPESVLDLDEEAARQALRPLLGPWVGVAAGHRSGGRHEVDGAG